MPRPTSRPASRPIRQAAAAAAVAAALLAAGAATAVEIPLRDGSTVTAAGYEITASYVLIRFEDGRRVAYDPADVDLDALRAGEEAAAPGESGSSSPTSLRDLAAGRSLDLAPEASTGPTITDHDVAHVDASGERVVTEEEREQQERAGTPEGYQKDGRVALASREVVPLGEGKWQVGGEVVNLNPDPALDIKVRITVPRPDSEALVANLPVANVLGPDERGSFSHVFTLPADDGVEVRPDGIRFDVFWMQEKGSVRDEQRRPVPNAAPPPPGQQRQRIEIYE